MTNTLIICLDNPVLFDGQEAFIEKYKGVANIHSVRCSYEERNERAKELLTAIRDDYEHGDTIPVSIYGDVNKDEIL